MWLSFAVTIFTLALPQLLLTPTADAVVAGGHVSGHFKCVVTNDLADTVIALWMRILILHHHYFASALRTYFRFHVYHCITSMTLRQVSYPHLSAQATYGESWHS